MEKLYTMAKNVYIILNNGGTAVFMRYAYLIITDLHIINKMLVKNRISYRTEIEQVEKEIDDLIDSYKDRGFIVRLIFLGDLYHRGYTDPIASIKDNNYLVYLSKKVDSIYSVMGNHELSYYKNNPFYTLFNKINSEKINNIHNRVYNPLGVLQVLNVVDTLEDGEVLFTFNHYGCGVEKPIPGKVNIGLFHQDLICQEILDDIKRRYKIEGFTEEIINLSSYNVFEGYDYCFLGHMHKAYGTYNISDDNDNNTIRLYYLASLGRTNHTEIQDNFRERNVPAVLIDSGKFECIEDNKFLLMKREDCILENEVLVEQEKRKTDKAFKEIKNYNASFDDPVKNVLEQISGNKDVTTIFMNLRSSDFDKIGREIKSKVEKVKGERLWI